GAQPVDRQTVASVHATGIQEVTLQIQEQEGCGAALECHRSAHCPTPGVTTPPPISSYTAARGGGAAATTATTTNGRIAAGLGQRAWTTPATSAPSPYRTSVRSWRRTRRRQTLEPSGLSVDASRGTTGPDLATRPVTALVNVPVTYVVAMPGTSRRRTA